MVKKTENTNSHLSKHRDISSFLNEEYRDYSLYCAMERCTPSLIDGFKLTQRKILHSAFKGACKSGNLVKMLNLTGDTLKETLYAHGDGSLNSCIIGLGQVFSDVLTPLYIEGQSGSLRDQDAVASPRYLYVKLNKWANLYKEDYDLLEFINEEGQYIEPKYYLPIIPTVLCRQAIGLAPGYRFNTMSYNPVDLVDACIAHIQGKSFKMPRPYINGIKPENWQLVYPIEGDKYWVNKGVWEYNFSKDKMIITDLPYDMGYDDFEKLLNKYCESELIKDWFNYSEGDKIHYEVIFEKGRLKKEAGKENNYLPNKFKLIKKVPENQLYVLDENNKVRYFETPADLIKYFTEFRLTVYNDRKTRLLKVLNDRLTSNSDMCRFIELIIKNKLKINNRPKKDIKEDMKGHNLPDHLIGTPISKLTKEEYEALLKENEDIRCEIEYITKTTIEEMYINDLKKLRKELLSEINFTNNDTDKVKQEKPETTKVDIPEVKEAIKRKRRTKTEMEADKVAKEKEKLRKAKAKLNKKRK